ncbi:glycosyltransferase family 2 protein [Herminiimonas sp. NPDC097707]|uniref:glycosyltransferase family 2 protein n=1 Tax=Herminiimonas sp. NPDC097707 TaxID=3364007 RepID=UPI00383BAEBA
MESPLLTIVTVTKNCANTLEKTLLSVQAIKNSDIEYLVIDGVSTDGTLQLLEQYGGIVDRMVSEPDTGIYNAMNKGICFARGKYILFINGDDELLIAGFPEVLRVLQSDEVDIISAVSLIGSFAVPTERLVAKPWQLWFFNSIPHPSTFVKSTLLKEYLFREDLKIAADYDFFLRAYLSGHTFKVLSSITALHHRGGASGNTDRSLAEVELIRFELLGWRYPVANFIKALHRRLKGYRAT